MKRFFRGQRSQAMSEFALVSPILLLIIFGIFDFGRGIVDYVGLQNAANEAARVVIQGEPTVGTGAPPYTPPCTLIQSHALSVCGSATNEGAIDAALKDSGGVNLVVPDSGSYCPNGPILTSLASGPPAGQGWVYVTGPSAVADNTTQPAEPNAPEGDTANGLPGGKGSSCWRTVLASNHVPLTVTVVYHFSPITPLIGRIVGNNIFLIASSTYETEY